MSDKKCVEIVLRFKILYTLKSYKKLFRILIKSHLNSRIEILLDIWRLVNRNYFQKKKENFKRTKIN